MFEEIRNKYLYKRTQIVELNKSGIIQASDDLIYPIRTQTSITDFHPFFETIVLLIEQENKDFTFSCIHIDINSNQKIIDVIFNTGSNQVHPFLIFIDFTEHYNNFQSIAQEKNESVLSFHLSELKNQQLESEKSFKNKFLANVSHDLKTPLSASLWFIAMLEKSEVTEQQRQIIELLKETATLVKSLVDDILDLSKIEVGQMELQIDDFNFIETITFIEQIIKVKAEAKKLNFILKQTSDVPEMIKGDKVRVIQILVNLLDNAIKFTKIGTVILELGAAKISNHTLLLKIKVIDTGIGINSSNKSEAFQSFKKLHDSKKIEGSGLGLSIVSNLVNLMNGKIDYTSEVGVGTTFEVVLPFTIDA
ncbi:HAMP domain-containing sensor histidine kinase [Flavobacterium sp. SUN052]|uniref:sensor histidine kinase n=1 Tax=Flavobacterium sp. SUN052 TaxID=3002441 RepID=UPI00237E8CEF|nr:HAMP domain-containing sensor histidine kinase [Flavobacterium sp. SUN052]MEC4004142.1 HAMP domain-containing sensor histidine kinase [Flavobacterium sp. SUN052]